MFWRAIDWFYQTVEYTVQKGLFSGTSETTFEPNAPVTRAMLVTILWRAEGMPKTETSITFEDVDLGGYYAEAVRWAASKEIVHGHSDREFASDDNITREQIAAIMYRYAKYKGYDVSVGEETNILSYTDFEEISEYAIPAIQYAAGAELIKSKTESTLNPRDHATRAETAAILQRFLELNQAKEK